MAILAGHSFSTNSSRSSQRRGPMAGPGSRLVCSSGSACHQPSSSSSSSPPPGPVCLTGGWRGGDGRGREEAFADVAWQMGEQLAASRAQDRGGGPPERIWERQFVVRCGESRCEAIPPSHPIPRPPTQPARNGIGPCSTRGNAVPPDERDKESKRPCWDDSSQHFSSGPDPGGERETKAYQGPRVDRDRTPRCRAGWPPSLAIRQGAVRVNGASIQSRVSPTSLDRLVLAESNGWERKKKEKRPGRAGKEKREEK